jgi:hypothetical protein
MKNILILLMVLSCIIPSILSQTDKPDTLSRFGLHLGVNFGSGLAGGAYGGGGILFSPRVGVHYHKRFILGLESNVDYQIIYLKDSLADQSILLSKWIGPFFRFYAFQDSKNFNIVSSINYVFGSIFVWSNDVKFREIYHTAIIGLGGTYKIKSVKIEFGFRHTFLLNTTPIQARWANTMFLGLTKNF